MNATGKSDDVRGSGPLDWESIDWKKAEESVRKLQARIVKAQREGRHGKVRSLSRILTRSFAAQALAVKRVTQNQGQRRSGVDGELWTSPRQKAKAVLGLNVSRLPDPPSHSWQLIYPRGSVASVRGSFWDAANVAAPSYVGR